MTEKRKPQISIPLDIPDVEVLATEINARGDYVITVESRKEGTQCRQCGREIAAFHGHGDWIELRHLPILDRAVYIRLRPKRYRCPYCWDEPSSTQQLSWYDPKSPHTKAYEDALLLQLINSTIQDVSLKAGIGYEAVMGVVHRRIQTTVDWEALERLQVLGLDEIALKKGHKDFVVIVTVRHAEGRVGVLVVLPDRKKKTASAVLARDPKTTESDDSYGVYRYVRRLHQRRQRNAGLCGGGRGSFSRGQEIPGQRGQLAQERTQAPEERIARVRV